MKKEKHPVDTLEYWKSRSNSYEWLYHSQKEVTAGYKGIIEDYKNLIEENNSKFFQLTIKYSELVNSKK
jgi:hypothetical protein